MELWIRSQDRKSLIKSNGVGLTPSELSIYPIGLNGVLGTYETKERALEVLDEIQEYITPTLSLLDDTLNGKQICQVGNILSMVYKMPKE